MENYPSTLLQAVQYFSDEDTCISTVKEMLFPNGIPCHECGAGDPYYLKTAKRWKCRNCRIQFSIKRGTIFEDSPIALSKWLPALWMLVNCKNGISSHELARALGISQKSAWHMLHRLRLVLKKTPSLMGMNGGSVEVDETYVGGKPKNMHRRRRIKIIEAHNQVAKWKAKERYPGKTSVMGIFDRETRQVLAKVVPDTRRETLQNEIVDAVQFGSKVYTDQAVAYDTLKTQYVHETVSHIDNYVRGQVHTNCLENFWSLTKRNLAGTYVCVEPFHLDRYLDEQMFRFNNRATKDNPLNDRDRFLLALSRVGGKRLTFAEVTGKTERPSA